MQVRYISNITKEYPDMIKVIIYKEPKTFVKSDFIKRNREEVNDDDYIPSISSLTRTKTLVRDLVLCNDFELFCTFTFDPKLIDSFNYRACWGKMSRWLHRQSDRSREAGKQFKYLIIPEKHKSGRWHFHALISGYIGSLKPSGYKTVTCRTIYNMKSFRSGFTTAVEIDSKECVSSYVTKYITKDFITSFNQRRFMCSRNLIRPIKTINSSIFRNILPIFGRKISESKETFEFVIDKTQDIYNNLDKATFTPNVAQYRF